MVVGRTPYVEPLLQAEVAERWCLLLVNRRSARFFLGAPADLEETDRVEDNVHSQHRQGGWSQPRYQRSVEEDVRDHLAHSAAVVFDLFQREGFEHLLIGAPDETVGDLERKLHPYLQERLAGHIRVSVEDASVDEVRSEAARGIEEHERRRERELLDRLEQGLGSGGRAAAGADDVLGCLEEARVDTLLLAADLRASGVAERATEKALESSAEVVVVRHHDLTAYDGIAALLRY